MPYSDITINKPLDVVWDFFTNPKNWGKWWPSTLEKVDPGWQEGATLVWGNGDTSSIRLVAPKEAVQIEGAFLRTTYQFVSWSKGKTYIEVSFVPRGGASFSDGGQAYKMRLDSALAKLKQCLESEKS